MTGKQSETPPSAAPGTIDRLLVDAPGLLRRWQDELRHDLDLADGDEPLAHWLTRLRLERARANVREYLTAARSGDMAGARTPSYAVRAFLVGLGLRDLAALHQRLDAARSDQSRGPSLERLSTALNWVIAELEAATAPMPRIDDIPVINSNAAAGANVPTEVLRVAIPGEWMAAQAEEQAVALIPKLLGLANRARQAGAGRLRAVVLGLIWSVETRGMTAMDEPTTADITSIVGLTVDALEEATGPRRA